jgi:hypothetical protein
MNASKILRVSLLLLVLLQSKAFRRPTGPGVCVVNGTIERMNSQMPLGFREKSFNVTLNSSSVKENDVVEVTLNGARGFAGLLLIFESVNGEPGGSWTYPQGFKRPPSCGWRNVALGHSAAFIRKVPARFLWTAPSRRTITADSFTLRGIVVRSVNVYGTLEPVRISVAQVHFALLWRKG